MDPQITLVIAIVVVSLILFATERFPTDVIALGIVVTLIMTGLLTTQEAFAGFGSEAVMMIFGLLIMTASLMRTGVVELAGRFIFQLTGDKPKRILIVVMGMSGVLSSFMSNAATTAFFMPIVIGLAHRAKLSASIFLMPLAFASILASSVTLIATSTNIVVSGLITQYGLAPLGVFELTPVGIPILVMGLLYMYFIGSRLIPDRSPVGPETQNLNGRVYVTEMVISPNSSFAGKQLVDTNLGRDFEIQVLRVVRDNRRHLSPSPDLVLESGDILLAECGRGDILKIQDLPGVEIKADHSFSVQEVEAGEIGIVEVILLLDSPFIGRTLRGLHARDRFGLQVLAINRHGEPIRQKLSSIRMHLGDVLLIQGDRSNIDVLEQQSAFRILDDSVEAERPDLRRAPRAVLIFVVALLLAAFNLVPLPVAALGGAVVSFMTRCITPEEAYRLVDWKVLILIGSMLALGVAMEQTGTAAFLAQQIVNLFGSTSPIVLLSAFFFLTVVLTQPLSNQAAAVVVLPVAIRTALQLDLDPRSFAVMIAVAASSGFLTPLEPACVMVYGSGRYRFMDFVRVGALLTVVIFVIAIVLIPALWPPI